MQKDKAIVTQRLKSITSKAPSKQPKTLYNHLCQLIPQLQQFSSDKISPINNLQYISEYLKKHQYNHNSPFTQHQLHEFINKKVDYPHWIKHQENFIHFSVKNSNQQIVNNFQLHSERLFDKVGLGFGREESARIYIALKRLAEDKQAVRLRFWGKILARNGDYLVIEGVSKKVNTQQITGDRQKAKEGVNYNTYWVSSSSMNTQWTQLPLISPHHIKTSRLIKYAFTGELDRPVFSSPPFEGSQKHLLKAQIVRITHNCQIAPKGLYSPLEDNPDEVDFSEEFKMPDFAELPNLQNWVHFNPYILKQGRASYYVDPKLPQDQKEEFLGKLAQSDPKVERLKAINEDKGLQKFGLQGCWSVRTYGTTQLFNNVGKEQGTTSCYAVVALRNPHWPGWTTVASSKQYASIYIGYGAKSSQAPFHPLGPEDINVQAEDVEEFHEPNPKDPPDELEPDSDDENKKVEQG